MSQAPLQAGAALAPGYEVIAHLSRGRSLDVYDVWSAERGSRVIAKAVRPERRDDHKTCRHLIEEGRLLCELTHPHIVRGYETLTEPDPIVVMETLRGETLGHLIECGAGPLDPTDLAQLGLQVASAIRYLHGHGILHLDLKPSNLVAETGRAKLIDLSVARPPGSLPAGIGTWCYMAPEQARGGSVGPAADVWGIGVVLFEAATGEPPFDDPDDDKPSGRPSASESLEESDGRPTWADTDSAPYPQLIDRARRVDDLRDLPVELADIVETCLEPDPALRPSVEVLLARLEAVGDLPPAEWRWLRRESSGSGPPHADRDVSLAGPS